jgi:hypothetical protein
MLDWKRQGRGLSPRSAAYRFDASIRMVISIGRCNRRGVGEARQCLAERDALRKKFLAVFFRQCPFVSFHPRCSCPPRAALGPRGNSRWGLATATVKNDINRHKRTPTEAARTKKRWANQLLRARSATGSFVPIPSNDRMQSALLHSPIEITFYSCPISCRSIN